MSVFNQFLWGVSTAGHQVDGNDDSSDTTFLEHVEPSVFKEPAGDACRSWKCWEDDLDCVQSMGLNSYRFSIEWCRIEPERGFVSQEALDHYDRMLDGCIARGISPVITLCHFTCPHWFAKLGGWLAPEAEELFAAHARRVMELAAGRAVAVVTLNEPNLSQLLAHGTMPSEAFEFQQRVLRAASEKAGVEHYRLGNVQDINEFDAMDEAMARAHRAAVSVVREVAPGTPVGLSLSVTDDDWVTPAGRTMCEEKRASCYGRWVDAVQGDDFIGVQNYERMVFGDGGLIPPSAGLPLNGMGTQVASESLARAVLYIHEATSLPVLVTEHGISTDDDHLRCDFLRSSIPQLASLVRLGIPVLGYFHWTLLDNFEWISAFDSRLGLYEVDRRGGTYDRIPKPSSRVYADLARLLGAQLEASSCVRRA